MRSKEPYPHRDIQVKIFLICFLRNSSEYSHKHIQILTFGSQDCTNKLQVLVLSLHWQYSTIYPAFQTCISNNWNMHDCSVVYLSGFQTSRLPACLLDFFLSAGLLTDSLTNRQTLFWSSLSMCVGETYERVLHLCQIIFHTVCSLCLFVLLSSCLYVLLLSCVSVHPSIGYSRYFYQLKYPPFCLSVCLSVC